MAEIAVAKQTGLTALFAVSLTFPGSGKLAIS
jgi:hypothetical protein